MSTFPTPFAGVSALYPVTQAKRFPVAILKWDNLTETRYRQSAGISSFVLELAQVTKAEKDLIVDFFETCKGSFDATWSITLGADTYDHMAFAEDKLTATESTNGLWSMSVAIRQTRKN